MFAIAGVSGNTGKVAAEALLARGEKVRVIVRDEKKGKSFADRGAEVAVADLGDVGALTAALRGVTGAYLLVPPNLAVPSFRDYAKKTTEALVSAVRESRLPRLVFLSSIGADRASGTGPIAGLHHAENLFSAISGTRSTFVRAAYFMENVGGSLGALEQGVLPSFFPADFAFDMVATKDIGELVAERLLRADDPTKIVNLAGPAPVSMNDAARSLTSLVGKPITVAEAPTSAMVATLTGFGFPLEMAELYREMTDSIVEGRIAWEAKHELVRGKTPMESVLRGLLKK